MEEKTHLIENYETNEEQVHQPKNTKQQTVLYTAISIALFCLIYFGGNIIVNSINRPYNMYRCADNTTEEILELQYEYAHVSEDYGLDYEYSMLEKNESGYMVSILFSGIEDVEEFTENGILFEYGNAFEDIENVFCPYISNMEELEYVVATKYVDIDDPNNEILIFEYEGKSYAEFQSYGALIPTEVKILFDSCEKVY